MTHRLVVVVPSVVVGRYDPKGHKIIINGTSAVKYGNKSTAELFAVPGIIGTAN